MKFRLKLLKDWTDPAGNEFKAGDVIELEDEALAKNLIFDETAEKYVAQDGGDNGLNDKVKQAVTDAMKDFDLDKHVKDAVHLELHDKGDDDPFLGYMPDFNGTEKDAREMPYDRKAASFAAFACDVAKAAEGQPPERLVKCQELSRQITEKAIKNGIVKAAGDGVTVGTPSEGGVLIPPEFNMMLLDAALEVAVVRPRATVIPIGSDRIELPQVKNYDHSSSTVYGGIACYWKGENAQLTSSKPALEEIGLTLNPLTALAYASHRMLRFSPIAVGSWLLPMMAKAIAWKEDDGFINGTGAGMPLGILNGECVEEVAIESEQELADGLQVWNVAKMVAAHKVENSGKVVWLYNKADLLDDLIAMALPVGTGGAPMGIVQQITNSPNLSLLGRPLVDTEHCQAAGTAGDIILCDMSAYLIADDRKGAEAAQSMHLKFDYAQEAFRIIKYVDGQPRYSSTFTRQNSTASVAPFVTLAARS